MIMRRKIVAGNWKMNTTVAEGVELAKQIIAKLGDVPENVHLIINTPFTHLYPVSKELAAITCPVCKGKISLGAQNCADKEKGAYTGEVSAAMLASVPVTYVILGHSERREYYHETNAILKEKMKLALANGLSVIYCCGENLEQRESGKHLDVVGAEIKEVLFDLTPEEMKKIVVAYEPIWAIGTGKTATSAQAEEIHAFIRKTLAEKFGAQAEEVSILYGGSCKPSNAKELFAQKDIDGGLIGGASLKADDFVAIAQSY